MPGVAADVKKKLWPYMQNHDFQGAIKLLKKFGYSSKAKG
jgi:hypothetical protein